MRLSISKRESYHADIYCADSKAAKKALREQWVSVMALDFYLRGRDNGKTILQWAKEKQLLPQYVVITESDRDKRIVLSAELSRCGYNTADGTTFVK